MQWLVSLFFAVEVGAKGYYSTSLKSCLLRLRFPGKLVRTILKSLSLASLKSSFQIRQARDSKERIPTTRDPVINANLKNDKQSLMSPKAIHSDKVRTPVDFAINKQSAKPSQLWTVEQGKYLLHKGFPSVSQHHRTVMVKFHFL